MTWLRFTFGPIGMHVLLWSMLPVVMNTSARAPGRTSDDGDALIPDGDGLIDVGPSIATRSMARRLHEAETAQHTADRLVHLSVGWSDLLPMSLVDDPTIGALTAVETAGTMARPDDEQDSRDLLATGGGRNGAW